ncbi:and nb-arc domain containing protein [Grosmannia clavigera kw1407]|uniref:And nb-arc domain containing protein n=1 Tax=Grosmannia clavigera (strain kw1407 / UAMH 11150) TaxID=655863 RepID=F0XEI0_GROCL|nr:and nb-arc domain containing protein [Grosmannia clavigera kw1407]EFX04695.1 and nb-arc domain containing protein [Grosmannia clavigera kw1407]
MDSVNQTINRYEVTGIYTHPDARVDIVLVHGLNGNPQKTWTAKNGVFWPADLLTESLKDRPANILVYGYNADVYSHGHKGSASDNFIYQHAQTLVTHLTAYRARHSTTRNPIIWIAHSLGGILVKRALLYSNDVQVADHDPLRAIFVSTYAIIFLGTPHNGSGLATWGLVLHAMSDAIIPKKWLLTEPVLLKTLKHDNERLQEINSHFLDVYQRFKIHMVHENHTTDLKGTRTFIVTATSASPQLPGVMYYGIEADHSGMCKFDGPSAPGYFTVSSAIYDWVEEAPPVIDVRWNLEDTIRRSSYDPPRPSIPSTPVDPFPAPSPGSEPPFLHPESFRPNSYFVGRRRELEDLHAKLTDEKKRAEGTSAVLIQCLPGGGKTHLARQYVFEHRADYPGGIYWVRAKSITEMEQVYWRIATELALDQSNRSSNVVENVRSWFNCFDQWLLIFDGIHFDTPGVRKFIPDAKNTSLIYTSMQHSATGMYEFDNPQVIELGLLDDEDAQNLLLAEMEMSRPPTQDDLSYALELVQLMGRLPLMIHVAARHLHATREPLSKYLREYKTRPRAGRLPAYRAVHKELERRGANTALNLMSILAFYDHLIPVGLITLGLGGLTNITPVVSRDLKPEARPINKTLRILIAFALIERTEINNVTPASSQNSAKRSFDRSSGYVDVLRVHGVVQAFFVDLLAEKRELNFWLERAAAVFCASVCEADRKITEDAKLGLPDDYRRFMIHGRKLLEHLRRAEKKGGASSELTDRRADVEAKLGLCQAAIDQFEATQSQVVTIPGPTDSQISVFERADSFSATDSSYHDSSSGSGLPSRTGTGFLGWDREACASPTDFIPDDLNARYPPYPKEGSTIPGPPSREDSDELAEMATPRVRELHGGAAFPPRSETHSGFFGWISSDTRQATSGHRTVRRQESRRYHDWAGSWRDKSISDPRTELTRQIAEGKSSRRETIVSEENAPGGSEAEISLHRIKARSQQGVLSLSTDILDAHDLDEDLDGSQPVQEGQKPLDSSIASLLDRQQSPLFRGSRTAQSSPNHGHGPFYPPPRPGPDGKASLQHDSPASIRLWDNQSPTTGRSQFDTSDLSFGMADDLTTSSHSRPLRGSHSYPVSTQQQQVAIGYWRQHSHLQPSMVVDGYTSQPMSRGGSGSRSFTSVANDEDPFSRSLPSSHLQGWPASAVDIPPRELRSPASYVETEPSPDTGNAFAEVRTSYQQWGKRHSQGAAVVSGSRAAAMRMGGRRSSSQSPLGSPARPVMDAAYTSEPMARSGSGGIKLPDGRLIPFGQSPRLLPVDVMEVVEASKSGHVDDESDVDGEPNVLVGLGIVHGVRVIMD